MGRWEKLIAVVGIAIGGVVLAITAWAAPQSQPPAEFAVPEVVAPPPATEVTETTQIVVPPPPPPVVDELPAAVAGVLAERGHTELMDRAALLAELPPNVVALLIEHEIVLTVAEGEDRLP